MITSYHDNTKLVIFLVVYQNNEAGQLIKSWEEAQWLRGRVLDSTPRGGGFEPHQRHCVVSLSKTHLSLLSTGSTQEEAS